MNAIVKQPAPSLLMDPDAFTHMQRVGSMLALSPLFPDHLRKGSKETAIANGVLVMNMAARLNEDPLTVAQNIYFVSGKPGWSSSYMIGKANQHGVFKNPISWEIKGKGSTLSVTAFAELKATGQRVEATCDMAMAEAEGWAKNAKYKSMPEQMLRYRSATFMIRLYCPEVMVGIPAQVEVELGMKDVTPGDYAQMKAPQESASEATDQNPEKDILDAETVAESEEPSAKDNHPEQPTGGEAETPDYQGVFNTILADLEEAPSADAVRSFYEEQLKMLAEHAPEIFQQVEGALKKKDGKLV